VNVLPLKLLLDAGDVYAGAEVEVCIGRVALILSRYDPGYAAVPASNLEPKLYLGPFRGTEPLVGMPVLYIVLLNLLLEVSEDAEASVDTEASVDKGESTGDAGVKVEDSIGPAEVTLSR